MAAECRLAVRLMLALGQRSGEVCGMLWGEVDIEGRMWSIPAERSKNGLAHRVPLTDTALEFVAAGSALGAVRVPLIARAGRGNRCWRVECRQGESQPLRRGEIPAA